MRTEKHVGTEDIVQPRYLSLEFSELEKKNNPCCTRRERKQISMQKIHLYVNKLILLQVETT